MHRYLGSRFLSGCGLEIGALHQPFDVPRGCEIEYLDVEDEDTLRRRFPEIKRMVRISYVGDVGRASVRDITGKTFDFVVMNHVLEHVANPIQVISNVLAGLQEGGLLVLSIPDRNFCFDRSRVVTTFEHLCADYYLNTCDVSVEHYVDFLTHVHPEVFVNRERFLDALEHVMARREHVHVWDSETFRATLRRILHLLNVRARFLFESLADLNSFEYFAVLRITGDNDQVTDDEALKVLMGIYLARSDLQHAFPAGERDSLDRLLSWALTAGIQLDGAREILHPYREAFEGLVQRRGIDWKEVLHSFK